MTVPRQRCRTLGWMTALAGVAATVASCGGPAPTPSSEPNTVSDTVLAGLLLAPNEISAALNGAPLIVEPVVTAMSDNRNLLPNLNCLGVWHIAENAIYGQASDVDGWNSVRRQSFRGPGQALSGYSVDQAVTTFASAQAARDFVAASAQRWTKCTNHTVNITLNDQRLPRWVSGALAREGDRLTIPVSRTSGVGSSSCQRVLSAVVNVVIDVEACAPRVGDVTSASEIATRIASHVPSVE